MDRRLDNCTFAKTCLMFCVILGHSISFWNGAWFTALTPETTSVAYKYLAIFVGGFHIYAFALISGYIFYYLKIEKKKYVSYSRFVLSKTKRLLVPYFFILVIWVVPIAQHFYKYNSSDLITKFLLGVSPSQLWFLLMLFWVFIIVWPISKFLNNHSLMGVGVILAFYVLGIGGTYICKNYFMIWTATSYIAFFGCGFYLRKYKNTILYRVPSICWIGVYGAIYVLYILTYNVGEVSYLYKIYSYGLELVFHLCGALAAFFVFTNIGNRINWKKPLFSTLSKYSMAIYLLHEQFIYIIIALLNNRMNIYLLSVICLIGSIVISYIISKVLFKFKVTRFLIGEK